jgi:hypothetical protein
MPTFVHGKSAKVLLNGYDVGQYFKNASLAGSVETAEVSAFSANAKSFIIGLQDGTASLEGMYEGTASGIDAILAAAKAAAVKSILTLLVGGDAVGQAGYGLQGDLTKYEISNPLDDVVGVSAELQSSVGMERIISHHALGAETVNANGTAVNNGAASANGGVGYLEVTAFSGWTDATVKIQDSADGSSGWADILTFSLVTPAGSPTSQRVAIAGTVRQYTRYTVTFTGGGPGTMTFQVCFGRK